MNTIVVYVIPFFQIVFSKGKEQHKRDLLSVFHLCFPFPCMHGTWSEILTTLVQAHKSIKNVNGIFGFMPCSIVKGVIIRDIVHNIALPQDSHQVLNHQPFHSIIQNLFTKDIEENTYHKLFPEHNSYRKGV